MKTANKFHWIMTTVAMLTSLNVQAYTGEGVVLDPNTGDYLISYYGAGAPGDKKNKILRKVIFVPATKIEPIVQSAFKHRDNGEIVYTYRLTNGEKSRQPLEMMLLDSISDILSSTPLPKHDRDVNPGNIEQILAVGTSAINTPENWIGRSTISRAGGLRIGWSFLGEGGLVPGNTQTGFGFSSKDIPGIVLAQLQGYAPGSGGYPDDGPSIDSEASKQLESIEQHDFVTRFAAAPSIAAPTPFNAAILLDSIQTQTHTWIAMQLLDTTFSSQLDRYLTAAADSYRHNQPKAGKEHIQTLRRMLKKEHEDADKDDEKEDGKPEGKNDDKTKRILIDRLAARVLDFDLKYVLKRMGGDKDD